MKRVPIAVWLLVKLAYRTILRDLLVKAIDDPEKEWDDAVLRALDGLFGYDGDPK